MMLEWILSSCLVILAVLALRAGMGKRISANLRYALWALVLVRLLIPVQLFTSPVAGLQVNYSAPEILKEESVYILPVQSEPAFDAADVRTEGDKAVTDSHSFGYSRLEDGGQTVRRYVFRVSPLEVLEWGWVAGSTMLAAALLISNLCFAVRLRRVRRPLGKSGSPIPMYVAEGLPSPCLFGLFRTAVYVTPQAAENPAMLRHVKVHELTHYRHLDHLWSILRGAALAVHWWNPLVWLAVFLSRRDGELACDESALKQLGDGERRAYGETLLSLVTAKPSPAGLLSIATTMTGGKKSLQERVRRIACKQKHLVSATVAVVLLLCVTVICAFGRKAEDTSSTLPESEMGPASGALPYTLDLNRDGIQEQILRIALSEGEMPRKFRLEVVQGGECLWTDTMDDTHGGCNTYFLYQENGLDYLLEYMPKMQQGSCTYSYRLFHLENGEEVTDRENSVEFDINFSSQYHQFDPAAIAAFMEEVNALIGESKMLVNTNSWMVCFEETEDGRLYDDILSALNHPGEDLHDMPLLEALEIYARQAEDHPDDTNSPLNDLLTFLEPEDLAGGSAQLVQLLREAASNRLSRFHEYAWFAEEEAWTWSTAELTLPVKDEGTLYLLACDSGNVELGYETEDGYSSAFYESEALYAFITEAGQTYPREILPYMPDLDHDGEPDQLVLRSDRREMGYLLECTYGDSEQVWSGYANTSHAGWNALFLCQLDGEDYLLQYNPNMSSGICGYQYKVFYLEEGGEVVVQENSVMFDILFSRDFSDIHQFDPRAIAAFMEEINGLLSNSIQLLNTDGNLLGTFETEGRLYDSLWWLDDDFTRDKDKTLLENLIVYQNQAAAQAAVPSVPEVLANFQAEAIWTITRHVMWNPPDSSYSEDKELLAGTLNRLAESENYLMDLEGEFDFGYTLVQYFRDDKRGDTNTILLEIGEGEKTENLVRITCEGEVTVWFYSENPDNNASYLQDVPYSVTAYVEDEMLYHLVRGDYTPE